MGWRKKNVSKYIGSLLTLVADFRQWKYYTPLTDQIDHDLDDLVLLLPLWDVVQDLHGTDPTREACTRSCRIDGSHQATCARSHTRSGRDLPWISVRGVKGLGSNVWTNPYGSAVPLSRHWAWKIVRGRGCCKRNLRRLYARDAVAWPEKSSPSESKRPPRTRVPSMHSASISLAAEMSTSTRYWATSLPRFQPMADITVVEARPFWG